MKKTFRTKIGLELILFLAGVLIFCFYGAKDIKALYVLIPFILFFVYIFSAIKYEIERETLTVKNAFFLKTKIPISEIKSVVETNNPLSSPAASLDRLYINYGKADSVIISPVNRDEFITELKHINPEIKVELKKEPTIFSKLAV